MGRLFLRTYGLLHWGDWGLRGPLSCCGVRVGDGVPSVDGTTVKHFAQYCYALYPCLTRTVSDNTVRVQHLARHPVALQPWSTAPDCTLPQAPLYGKQYGSFATLPCTCHVPGCCGDTEKQEVRVERGWASRRYAVSLIRGCGHAPYGAHVHGTSHANK